MARPFESISSAWNNLSEREQRLLGILGGVFATMLAALVVFLSASALEEIEAERDDLRSVLMEIEAARALLDQRAQKQREANARYRREAPALGSYMEEKAKEEGMEARKIVDQPEQQMGIYRRRHVRLNFSNIGLRPLMRMLSEVLQPSMPIAIEQLEIQHRYGGGDTYNVNLGVVAFDRESGKKNKPPSKEPGKAPGGKGS